MSERCRLCGFPRGDDRHNPAAPTADHAFASFDPAWEDEVARLREALEWYADSSNYMHTFDRHPETSDKAECGWRPVVLDAGQRARAALKGEE